MKKNKLLTAALALGVLATAGIATVPVHAVATLPGETELVVTITAPVLSVSLPTSYDFTTTANGSTNLVDQYIENKSVGQIEVVDVAITPAGGWKVVGFEELKTSLSDLPADTKQMGLKLNGFEIHNEETKDADFMADLGHVEVASQNLIQGEGVFPIHSVTTTPEDSVHSATVTFTVDWHKTV